MGYMNLRSMRRVFMQRPTEDTEKTKIDLKSRRRIRREVLPRNKAAENFNWENHTERSKDTLKSRQIED